MRVLYLRRLPITTVGRQAFKGRKLFDLFAERLVERAGDAIVAHIVATAGKEEGIPLEALGKDVTTARSYLSFDPHVIYFEGGLLGGFGQWRVPEALLRQSVRSGAVVVVADADLNEISQHRDEYSAARDFLRAQPRFGLDAEGPVYGLDRTTGRSEFDLDPSTMVISDWLRPVYDGTDRIVAGSPVQLTAFQDILASGDPARTATLCLDEWVDNRANCPFASVCQRGDGYVVFIAARVSDDRILERCPGNGHWLVNTIRHLRAESARDAARYAGLRDLQHSFRELKTTSESEAQRESRIAEVNLLLDRSLEATLRRESAQAARAQLEQIFGERWQRLSEQAQRQLVQAEVYRRDGELLADTDDGFEFSAPVNAYSKALEGELLRSVFEPFRLREDASELPERRQGSEGTSLGVLRRFLNGKKAPALGEMAYVLENVGCRLRDDKPNAFARYLRERLVDHINWCDEAGFPHRVLDYTKCYRNRADHPGELSAADCKEARDYLFEEPVRLLLYLTESLRSA
jgi:hypothetical protein